MAKETQRRTENVEGDFYVDSTCIDCDTCRWLAPGIFTRAGSMSAVHHQPQGEAETVEAFRALLACPTASIGCTGDKALMTKASQSFPSLISENVYYCGYAAESSFGAASYLIVRPEGNVLVDSPRVNGSLGKRIEALGGVRWMFFTHRDDVADHQEWTDRFGCERVIHKDDVGIGTRGMELQLEGNKPHQLAEDLLILPVPGHTKGHSVLIYKEKFLFSGDHLEFDEDEGKLRAYKDYCWYDWNEQIKSMQRLAAYEFEWVLPGHGRRLHEERPKMKEFMKECVDWMGKV
ncbi:MAG: MBL fold metallo-hydrolase [candidate division FCPU426 bacterium]